nr:hypothetical protein [Tanacetum cinerariifolium]
SDQNAGSLKAELKAILPELEEMKKRKTERRNQFLEAQLQTLEKEKKQKEKSISNEVIGSLAAAIQRLREIQNLAFSLLELWNLMVTPAEEQQMFQSITCKIAALEQEITEHNLLFIEFINY